MTQPRDRRRPSGGKKAAAVPSQNGGDEQAPPGPEPPVGEGENRDNRGEPGLEGMMVTSGGGYWNTARELVTGSTKPEEYLARTNISEKEWKRKKRIIANLLYLDQGDIDMEKLLWMDLVISPAFDGEARRQLVEVTVGQRMMDMARSGMNAVASARGINREQLRS